MAKTPPSMKMPRGIPSTTPRKMPSRALPPSTTPRQPPLVKGTSQSANVGARSPRLKETVLPKKFRSSQPMKMPTRALPSATTPRQPPPVKGTSQSANVGTPKLGGELPPMGVTAKLKKLPRATIKAPVTAMPSFKSKSRTPKSEPLSPALKTLLAEINAKRNAAKKDLALSPLKTTMTAKPRMPAPRMPAQRIMSTGEPSSKNYVQRSPRENIGTPGTKNFVQRAPRENIGTPNSSKFVRRTR